MSRRAFLLSVVMVTGLVELGHAESPSPQTPHKVPHYWDAEQENRNQELERQKTIAWLQKLFKDAMPTATIEATSGKGNTILLKGHVEHTKDVARALRLARSQRGAYTGGIVSALEIAPRDQVQVDVVFARVAAGKARRTHPELIRAWNTLTSPWLGLAKDGKKVLGCLQSLREVGLATIVAEPRLVTLSGRPATFFSGGEQAVPTGGLKDVQVQFVPYGTRISVLPFVMENGKVYLEVEPEISNLTEAGATQTGGTVVQGRTTRRVHTSIEMADGQSLIMAMNNGMVRTDDLASAVQSVPIVGETLADRLQDSEEREHLVILVTPHRIAPVTLHPRRTEGAWCPKGVCRRRLARLQLLATNFNQPGRIGSACAWLIAGHSAVE